MFAAIFNLDKFNVIKSFYNSTIDFDAIYSSDVSQRKDSAKKGERIERMSSRHMDQVVDAHSPARLRSYTEDVDELYSAQKLEYSQAGKVVNIVLIY